MAEKPKDWNASLPLEDEDLENEASERAKLRARTKFLEDELLEKAKKKKKSNLFD